MCARTGCRIDCLIGCLLSCLVALGTPARAQDRSMLPVTIDGESIKLAVTYKPSNSRPSFPVRMSTGSEAEKLECDGNDASSEQQPDRLAAPSPLGETPGRPCV
jgi:hypothetical protein